ncbi:MAG TPA: PD-(D/E)XK nuclease family protein [Pyrinomonadaceae bacterium]|nr:PD-(D/E)XK nuclease family protein [Pyrinomonadaceae bacterium]
MSKQIWLGPVLGTNRERLLRRCAEYIKKGQADRLLYIAASHPLLDLVTEKLLDGKNARGVWGEFPVYLFRGFVRRVLSSAIVSEARPSGRASVATEPLLTSGLLTHTVDERAGSQLPPRIAIDREELPLRRSLISQIIKQMAAAGKLKAIRPLANRDGCVNTVASLIGELQRAGKTPEEFLKVVEERETENATETQSHRATANARLQDRTVTPLRSQLDFDREIAHIYSAYARALDQNGLTDADADQLRALQILRGEVDGCAVALPWLDQIELLVLDGFFDFTPVQGEMLRRLIPSVPNVIVNLNSETSNEEIFRPFQSTIEHLQSITEFKTDINAEVVVVSEGLAPLRERLFNMAQVANLRDEMEPSQVNNLRYLTLLECGDRETEVRSIAKEVKRLILEQHYKLSEVALVVRERAAYADAIARVCAEESIPCNLERRVEAMHVPALRACGKLFQLLREPSREDLKNPKASDLAHLLKTGYFRIAPDDLPELAAAFEAKYATLLQKEEARPAKLTNKNEDQSERKSRRVERLRAELGIARWAPDVLENVIAYVGSELRVNAWLERAERLIDVFPSPEAARSLIAGDDNEDAAALAQDEAGEDAAPKDRRKKPAPIHPAAIAWTMLVMNHLRQGVASLPDEGSPEELRSSLMLLLDRMEFSHQVSGPLRRAESAADVPQATLDVRGLESLRRAFAAAVRSFSYAAQAVSEARASARATPSEPSLTVGLVPRPGKSLPVALSSFVDEVERSLRAQVLEIGAADRDGLNVLEATDVRGLRFRAVFIAGMIEGGFPLRAARDWLYPHEERERLKKYGVVLEDISSDTLLKEEHYFYQVACRATDRLYLTRPLAGADGNETVASYYIEELKRAIAPAQLETEQIRGDLDTQDLSRASTAFELSTFLVRRAERRGEDSAAAKSSQTTEFNDLLARAQSRGYISESALRRVEIESERNAFWFGPFDGEISNADLRAMLARHFGTEHVYSASGLSMYGNCSFRFFASRVLRLEPRTEAALDLQAIDAGKLLHDILRRFFEGHRSQYLPSQDREALRADLARVADQVFDEHERLVPPLNRRIWEIDREIRKLILDQVLLYELRLQERTNERGIRPAYFELAFGRASQASDPGSSTEYLKLNRASADANEIALVQGQIDRVDVNEQEKVAVAYDYKLSQGAKLEDIEAGRQVQIPIYLAALEQLFLPEFDLAGGGYYRLRGSGARLNQGMYRTQFADCTSVTSTRTKLDEIEWQRIRSEVQKRVWEFIDGMRAGDFRVRPSQGKATCKFCDYAPVCRYDTYRISRKRT